LPIGKSAITTISQLVTETSKNASIAAEDAERTEIMVTGLDEAAEKIEDIEILMIGISDQMSLLAVQTALLHDDAADAENLIHLDEKRSDKKTSKRASAKSSAGQSVNDRIDTIQGGTKRAIKAVQVIGRTINEVNEVARNFAAIASKEALEAANELLLQSEDLRAMLDNLLGKVDTSGMHKPQTKARDRD
jgi:methyl-accepting chemotaxis protein